MKTLIITLHSINNPGSAFQAYALNRYLTNLNIENEILDYRPAYSKIGKNKIKWLLKVILFLPNFLLANKKYTRFIKDNMVLSEKKYRSYSELKSKTPKADIYMTGSDQLWNPYYDCGQDDAYYLKFVSDGKKVAYSTSVGKDFLTESEENKLIEKISDFKAISVREYSTYRLLSKKMSIPIKWVCDPVFLLKAEDYMHFLSPPKYVDYAVVYLSKRSQLLESVISVAREKYGLTIIQAGGNTKRCSCDNIFSPVGPEDFLSLLYYSKLVISSSFHATAFSLIFQKNFVALLPDGNGDRIKSILKLTNLDWKLIEKEEDSLKAFDMPDYIEAESLLNPFVNESKEFLMSMVR